MYHGGVTGFIMVPERLVRSEPVLVAGVVIVSEREPVTEAIVVTRSTPAGPTPCTVIGAPTVLHVSRLFSPLAQKAPVSVRVFREALRIVPVHPVATPL
jgi:hypothetical protein